MSLALYIACESEIDGEDTFVSGKALGHVDPDTLEVIEKQLPCKSLSELMSYNPDDLSDFVDDVDESGLSQEEWFPAAEGLETVRQLRRYLQDNPASLPNAEDVIDDLDDCERVLELLAARDIGFHFALDF